MPTVKSLLNIISSGTDAQFMRHVINASAFHVRFHNQSTQKWSAVIPPNIATITGYDNGFVWSRNTCILSRKHVIAYVTFRQAIAGKIVIVNESLGHAFKENRHMLPTDCVILLPTSPNYVVLPRTNYVTIDINTALVLTRSTTNDFREAIGELARSLAGNASTPRHDPTPPVQLDTSKLPKRLFKEAKASRPSKKPKKKQSSTSSARASGSQREKRARTALEKPVRIRELPPEPAVRRPKKSAAPPLRIMPAPEKTDKPKERTAKRVEKSPAQSKTMQQEREEFMASIFD